MDNVAKFATLSNLTLVQCTSNHAMNSGPFTAGRICATCIDMLTVSCFLQDERTETLIEESWGDMAAMLKGVHSMTLLSPGNFVCGFTILVCLVKRVCVCVSNPVCAHLVQQGFVSLCWSQIGCNMSVAQQFCALMIEVHFARHAHMSRFQGLLL